MITTNINGHEYELASTLRVAYMVQGQHNHESYINVFQNIGEMPIEDQIRVLWAAFKCANKVSPAGMDEKAFIDYYLDNFQLKDVMEQLEAIVKGIMGTPAKGATEEASQDDSDGKEGN